MKYGRLLVFLKLYSQPVEVLTKTCTNMVYFVAVQGGLFCTHVARNNKIRNTLRVTMLYNVTKLLKDSQSPYYLQEARTPWNIQVIL